MKSINGLRDMLFSHANGHWVNVDCGKSEIEDHLSAIEREVEHDYVPMKDFAEMERFVDRIHNAADNRENVELWGIEYMALPVDANGETIHVGDKVARLDKKLSDEVTHIWLDGDWRVSLLHEIGAWYPPTELFHVHKPTRRELLRELICKATYLPIRGDDINEEVFDAFLSEHPELLVEDNS